MNNKYIANHDGEILALNFLGIWIVGGMLIVAACGANLNFNILRIFVVIYCAWTCFICYGRGLYIILGIFIIIGIIFNPIIKFHFEREEWRIIDVIVLVIMILHLVYEWHLNKKFINRGKK